MSEIEFLCKLRDAFRMAHEAIDEYLDSRVPKREGKQKSTWDVPLSWNPDKIKWESAEGTKGPYERCKLESTPDYHAMLKDLKAHDGKMRHDGYFYWVFRDMATVGRKKR